MSMESQGRRASARVTQAAMSMRPLRWKLMSARRVVLSRDCIVGEF